MAKALAFLPVTITNMSLYFLTGNKGKLAGARIVFPYIEAIDIDLPEIQSLDPHVIIKDKLRAGLEHHNGELVVEDTSVYIDSLNGLPGPLIKWFLEALDNKGLAELALKYNDHAATVKTIIGYANGSNSTVFFEGEQKGQIVTPRGNNGFGWNPIFQPTGNNKTFAEMDDNERSKFSMRTKAFLKLKEYLEQKKLA